MFISREEKQLILDVLELLEKRIDMLIERVGRLEKPTATITVSAVDAPFGLRKDGKPRVKPGRPVGSKNKQPRKAK